MIEDYIEAHIDPEPEHLRMLGKHANRSLLYCRMMSGHIQGRMLKMLTKMIKPNRIIELGTFAGYSTLCMAEALEDGQVVDTVEIDDELEDFLTQHFSSSSAGRHIQLHIGDALDIVPGLNSRGYQWDMAFIDADKRLYPQYYTMLRAIMPRGSWILADNTLWNGKVEECLAPADQVKDPQLRGILSFNDMVAADAGVEKVIVPLRDGLTIIRVK